MIKHFDGYKKILAAALASILAFVGFLNGLTVAEIAVIVGPLMLYIPGQGLADFGKERARVEKSRIWDVPPIGIQERKEAGG